MIHCLQGNAAAALLDLSWWGNERLDVALDWLARMAALFSATFLRPEAELGH